MKKRIAIYGGTELSAAESQFIESLTHGLLSSADVAIVTGGFLYWPEKKPDAISTDFSVLQGAQKYAREKGIKLEDIFETWLPDPEVENDPDKKTVVRFREGMVKELKGESAQARRFSMIRDVDALITVKGKKHTSMVLDFALTMNKPALPLAFTGGDSRDFWKIHKDRVKKWFGINDDFANEMEIKNIEGVWSPEKKDTIQKQIIAAVNRGLETESRNQEYYKKLQDELKKATDPSKKMLVSTNETEAAKKRQLMMFLSYAHEDAALKDELDKSLIALKRDERIGLWQDTDIRGGDDWDEKIKEGLRSADIILLLISPDFISSDYIWNTELPMAKEKHEQRKAKVIPIFLRDVFAENMWFIKLQGYISLDKPIATFKDYDRDTALKKVVQGISNDIDSWLNKSL